MLHGILVLLACQLVGEAITRGLGLGIPGPVVGLALLACGLILVPPLAGPVRPVAQTLLANLSLLFVPAAVGVVQVLPLLRTEGLAIGVAIVGSTALSLTVTALTFRLVARWTTDRRPAPIPAPDA